MEAVSKWNITDKEKDKLISALTPELALLRRKIEISQEELAGLIGISRQTYGAIERRIRKMSWNTYLSLILLYDYNRKTHQMIRSLEAFPHQLIKRFNDGIGLTDFEISAFIEDYPKFILDVLDEQAMRSIKTMIMVEYARCSELPSDAVIKSFDGINFTSSKYSAKRVAAAKAIKAIKESCNKNEE